MQQEAFGKLSASIDLLRSSLKFGSDLKQSQERDRLGNIDVWSGEAADRFAANPLSSFLLKTAIGETVRINREAFANFEQSLAQTSTANTTLSRFQA